jgi:hypothetical protein
VTDDVVVASPDPLTHLRVPLEGQRARVDRAGDLELVEHARQTPDADAAAELHVGLRAQVAHVAGDDGGVLPPAVVDVVPVEQRVLRALLVVSTTFTATPDPSGHRTSGGFEP